MMRNTLALGAVIAGLLAAGCSTTPKVSPEHLTNVMQLPVSASNPSPRGADVSKVVIFDVDTSKAVTADNAQAGEPIRFAIDGYLNDAGAEMVDRSLAAELKDEVLRAEMGGAGAYKGAPVADYAIKTTVTQASFGSSFSEASSWVDNKGKRHTTPPKCNYSSKVEISIDVYTVPQLNRVKSFRGLGSDSASEETRNSNCTANGGNLVRAAAIDSVYEVQEELKAFFAPTGYVLDGYETSEGKYVLKTSLTSDLGAKPGRSVRLINVTEDGDRYPVGEGKIGDPVVRSGAFVVVDDEVISRVRIGDEVRIDHSCSFLGCNMDSTLGLN
ncbi:hypothetical protein GCM10011533_16730 [Streptosporangium jomthongense]|uniref:Curli production assembly/transport component CsgG n=1 Tax=Marinobacter aromaticivorans TaxID=1494078 RepID=A0ABW2IUE6_9GAMM|nr:hypothetical protein [Marinobacter aromaticivorans]GGE65005.1 hypothetical protein GCM10011533_16730 [Streptosporangium jomthongense]